MLASHRLCLASVFALSLLGCDSGPTAHPDDEIEGEIAEGELTEDGPGGVGSLAARMGDVDPKIVEVEALLAKGKHQRGLELIDEAIAANGEVARYHFVRGNALTFLDDDAGAEAAYRRAIELDADDPLPLSALGQLIAFRDGATLDDKRKAAELFTAAIKLDPKLATAHQSLGVVLLALDQPQAAVEALDNADRLEGTVETAYLLAQAYGELGKFDEAVRHAARAVELQPDALGVDLRLLYARLLMQAGNADEAAKQFEQAAKLVPDAPPLRLEVARGLLELGRPDAAMVHMQWLLETIPNEIPVIVNHGRILVAQGKAKDAVVRFDAALAIEPGQRAALTYKIEALVAQKKCKDARKSFDELAKALGWDGGKALQAKPEELPRALAKAHGFMLPACK